MPRNTALQLRTIIRGVQKAGVKLTPGVYLREREDQITACGAGGVAIASLGLEGAKNIIFRGPGDTITDIANAVGIERDKLAKLEQGFMGWGDAGVRGKMRRYYNMGVKLRENHAIGALD
jgi:hypothetical protein